MKRTSCIRFPFAVCTLAALWAAVCLGQSMSWDSAEIDWSNYSLGFISDKDSVTPPEAQFGKEFQGFSLKVSAEKAEFEQGMPVPVIGVLKNTGTRSSLLAGESAVTAGRTYAFHLMLTDKEGASTLFSTNLLTEGGAVLRDGVPPGRETVIVNVPFDGVDLGKVDEFLDGKPYFDPKSRLVKGADLTPRVYKLRAILLSAEPEKRPDFLIASKSWNILVRPKSAERMSPAEREEKLAHLLARLNAGGMGGMAVADQLAAFGEHAVDALIAVAQKRGGKDAQATMESRVWALAILCNTGSPRAEAFVEKCLLNPISPGDLNYLAWHSQRFRSDRITAVLHKRVRSIAAEARPPRPDSAPKPGKPAPEIGFLGWVFRHFSRIGETLDDDVALGCLALGEPKIASLALDLWKPTSAERAVTAVKPYFTTLGIHPNVKRAVLRLLATQFGDRGFPKLDMKGDVNLAWRLSAFWLAGKQQLTKDDLVTLLRNQIIFARTDEARLQLVSLFQRLRPAGYPATGRPVSLPGDWVKTWQWCLQTGSFTTEQATQFLCVQMMTREELPDAVKRALLVALKQQIGAAFPLKSTTQVNLDEDWPTCGTWLVENGYFKSRSR